MKISDILAPEAILLDLASQDKRGALEEMANALAKTASGLDPAGLLEVLLEREKLQSTGMGEGVAIPHGRLPHLKELVVSFARSTKGVDFESIDGQSTHLFFLLVVPEQSGGQHLKALARISRFLRDLSFRKCLLEAESIDDVIRAIELEDARF